MADVYVCQVHVCMCCLQAAVYAEPCGCDEHATLSLLDEGDYLTLGNGNADYLPYELCSGCGNQGGDLFVMGYWRMTP